MFKKIVRLGAMVLAFTLLFGSLSACQRQSNSEEQTTVTETEPPQVIICDHWPDPTPFPAQELTIWSYNDDVKIMAIAFMETQPKVTINYVEFPAADAEYQNNLIAAANTDDCPDVVVLDAAFVREWVEGDMLANLNDLLPMTQNLQTYQNTIDVGTFDGECRAFSYQSTPGAVFYRRSLAIEYFGTDDPEEIQEMMADTDKFTDLAKTVKEKSDGKTLMVASIEDISHGILANREQPWFVDDTLVIDPIIYNYFDIAKEFHDNGYDAGEAQWSEGWFDGMNDTLTDENGDPVQIFCYFMPTWGFLDVMIANAPDTAGDWGCCPGPLPYQWGGSWLGVMKNTAIPELATEFIKFCTLYEQTLTNWATGVYTYDYIAAISPDLADSNGYPLDQPAGDFVSSKLVVEKIKSSFDDVAMSQFLGGQNYYSAFYLAAENCRTDLVQEHDGAIGDILLEAIEKYASGELPRYEAIDWFEENVENSFPDKIEKVS